VAPAFCSTSVIISNGVFVARTDRVGRYVDLSRRSPAAISIRWRECRLKQMSMEAIGDDLPAAFRPRRI